MNKKAELFQDYLKEKNITVFQVVEVPEDELNTVAFQSTIAVEGQALPTSVVLDSSIYGMINVLVARAALKEANEAQLIKAVNELNAKYKVFKYFFDPAGNLILNSCVLSKPGEVDGDMIYTVLNVIVEHITAEYKNIMKTIWA